MASSRAALGCAEAGRSGGGSGGSGGIMLVRPLRFPCLCCALQARALAAFRLDPEHWGVNVQPYSGR